MIKIDTKITLAAIALSATLLQGCVDALVQEATILVVADTAADKIRTNFSEKDFGSIDDSLIDKKSVYVSIKLNEKRKGYKLYHHSNEADAYSVCLDFKKRIQALKTQYNCYVVADKDSNKQARKGHYGTPKKDGVYLEVSQKAYLGVLSGSTYLLKYKDMATNKTHTFTSPNFYEQSQVKEYSAEYLARLAQKTNE